MCSKGRPITKSYNDFDSSVDLISFDDFVESNQFKPYNGSEVLHNKSNNGCNGWVESRAQFCGFCKRNGELPQVYYSHTTKHADGRVKCPQLYLHVCELCSATGEEAHTRSYCPLADLGRNDPFFKSMFKESNCQPIHNMVSLKRTRVNSAGKVRRVYK